MKARLQFIVCYIGSLLDVFWLYALASFSSLVSFHVYLLSVACITRVSFVDLCFGDLPFCFIKRVCFYLLVYMRLPYTLHTLP